MRVFPRPDPGAPGARVFRGRRLWELNVCGAAVAGMTATPVLLIVAATLVWTTRNLGWAPVLLVVSAAVGALAMSPTGNFFAMYPYAAEIVGREGVWFYAPLNKFYVPMEQVERVEWSYLRAGWVVRLKKRRGLVSRLVIHVAWGSRGRDLARAIEKELARRPQAAGWPGTPTAS